MNFAILRLLQTLTTHRDFFGSNVLVNLAVDANPALRTLDSPLGEYLVAFDLDNHVQRMACFGLYEVEVCRLIQAIVQPGEVFFDVGANVGVYTLLAAQLVGTSGQVHAFEPIAENTATIRAAIQSNMITQITVQQVAVGSHVGILNLFIGTPETSPEWRRDLRAWASRVPSQRRPLQIEVPQISLDEYIQQHHLPHVDVIKLDIEGSELEALRGGQHLLSRADAPNLICEISPYLLAQQSLDSRHLTEYLAGFGYTLFHILPDRQRILHRVRHAHQPIRLQYLDPTQSFPFESNLFCTKQPEQVRERSRRGIAFIGETFAR